MAVKKTVKKGKSKLRVCLYLENYEKLSGSGIGNAIKHQSRALELNGVEYTLDPSKFDYDILHVNFYGFDSNRYVKLARKKGIKVVISTHTTAEDLRNSFIFSNFLSPFLRCWLKRFYSKADLLISPSSYTKDLLKEKYSLKPKIVVVSNGIDVDRFMNDQKKAEQFRKEYSIKDSLILAVGLVFRRKGILDFIEVSRKFMSRNSFFWLGRRYGVATENNEMKNLIKNAPHNFRLVGYINDITAAYSACDIFFFPSYEENEAIVVLEAASMGKAIVVRDIPVFRSYLTDKKDCLMGSSNKEFEEMIRLLSGNAKLREQLGRQARKLAEAKSLQKVGAQLKKEYLALLNRR